MTTRKLISFDWAMKRILRSKANFGVLEGFLSELLHDNIRIQEILESESNKETANDKFNRVDMKVKNHKDELLIIEVQYDREYDYLQRILYGTSKTIAEHLSQGGTYDKVISVSILFFDLGVGEDYIYHGTTHFTGIHRQDTLRLSKAQREMYGKDEVHQLYPEYYLLRVNNFDNVARTSLDEWMYFFKNESIKQDFTARGLREAKETLQFLKLPEEERIAYERHYEELRHNASVVKSNYDAGMLDGEKKGLAAGLKEGEKKGRKEGLQEGLAQGEKKGREEGEKKGLEKGREEGRIQTLRRFIARRFGNAALTPALDERINAAPLEQLDRWLDAILDAATLEDVFTR